MWTRRSKVSAPAATIISASPIHSPSFWPASRVSPAATASEPQLTRLNVLDLEMDLLTRTVTRSGKPILLQPREFKLLEYLMRNAGHVVTRTMLLENVWDYHFDPQTNVIDVHISRLRTKIDKGFAEPMLQTVRGAGYMIRARLSLKLLQHLDISSRRLFICLYSLFRSALFSPTSTGTPLCSLSGRSRRRCAPRSRCLPSSTADHGMEGLAETVRRRSERESGLGVSVDQLSRPPPRRQSRQSPASGR